MSSLQTADPRAFAFVGYVVTTFPGSGRGEVTTVGSATLIGPSLVLTAGHVVFDGRHGGEANQFTVVLGVQNRVALTTTEWRTTTLWRDRDSKGSDEARAVSRGDLGVIILPKPIDLSLGLPPLAYESAPRNVLASKELNVAGYHAKEQNPNRLYRSFFRIVQSQVFDAYSSRIFYSVATLGGMSGGPVWERNPNTQTRTLRAIHTASFRGFGSAIRLADATFDLVEGWRTEFHPNLHSG